MMNIFLDGSWRVILSGLRTTVLISIVGLLIGTILGAVLCAMSKSRFKVLRMIEHAYTLVVRGTPVLMLLMLFYYVILAPLRTDALYTAFLAFGLNAGAHIGEIMKSALSAVDPAQIQAARTLGFNKTGAFFAVTLPQAAAVARPVYQNAIINLIQWTSVVGYISIADLTRVVNNLGSRTARPFMAMAVGIALYLLMATVVHVIFRLIDRRKRGSRV